eukprot:COSAG01_NODE_4188_length_5258_cov_53.863927_7_plen_205_part_00
MQPPIAVAAVERPGCLAAMMAEDVVAAAVDRLLHSPSEGEALLGLKSLASLALDEPETVVACGGVAQLVRLIGDDDCPAPLLKEAVVALFLLLEDGDLAAQAAMVTAGGHTALALVLQQRPDLPPDTADFARSALAALPPEDVALAVRDARVATLHAAGEERGVVEQPQAGEDGVVGVGGQSLPLCKVMRATVVRAGVVRAPLL